MHVQPNDSRRKLPGAHRNTAQHVRALAGGSLPAQSAPVSPDRNAAVFAPRQTIPTGNLVWFRLHTKTRITLYSLYMSPLVQADTRPGEDTSTEFLFFHETGWVCLQTESALCFSYSLVESEVRV